MPRTPTTTYLGDSIYATYDGYGVILFTNNGELNHDKTLVQKNSIYLEPDCITKLNEYYATARQHRND